jgi:hypothetical protein
MSVYTKLMAARLALQATKLTKSGQNTFSGYSYFELGDFLPAVQTIFAANGLCGVVSFGETMAELRIVDTDEAGGSIVIESPMSTAALKGCHAVQQLGAVQTYLRRYLWVTAMEIVEHDALANTKPDTRDAKSDKSDVGDVKASIATLLRANSPDELNAYWRVEVSKFDAKSAEYKALKAAASEHKKALLAVGVTA